MSDDCSNNGDVNFVSEYNGTTLTHGDNLNVESGSSNFTITSTVKKFSCPQNASLEVTLTPTGI